MTQSNFTLLPRSTEAMLERVKNAITALRLRQGVLVLDAADRENEADIIFPAETLSLEQMALLIRHGSGIVCLCLTEAHRQALKLSMMVAENKSRYQTPFTVSIEAATGVTTGVSAADRLLTIRRAIAPNAVPDDLVRPGHVFPLVGHPKGLEGRAGHTEATLYLMELAGYGHAGVLCELMNPDGTMARFSEMLSFSTKHYFPWVTIEDLLHYAREPFNKQWEKNL